MCLVNCDLTVQVRAENEPVSESGRVLTFFSNDSVYVQSSDVKPDRVNHA
jgi:hypothetical protein